VAAILEAAAAIIDEKGYEGATMAEIAARSGTKIGSLYRFFPNKESLAGTIVVSARENLEAMFDQFDAGLNARSVRDLADDLVNLLLDEVFTRTALTKLLDASQDWSVKREEFRNAVLRRMARTLKIYRPNLRKRSAEDIALVILLNTKTAAKHKEWLDCAPNALDEFRDMTRLYLQSRLGSSLSAKKGITTRP
jgi:AcrR family transcriptional regulator